MNDLTGVRASIFAAAFAFAQRAFAAAAISHDPLHSSSVALGGSLEQFRNYSLCQGARRRLADTLLVRGVPY
jgi:hypothetical protein